MAARKIVLTVEELAAMRRILRRLLRPVRGGQGIVVRDEDSALSIARGTR